MTERDLFLAALDLPDPAARAAFLAQRCGTDTDQRRRVEGLLAAHTAAGNFLDRPAGIAALDPDATVPPRVDPAPETDTVPPLGSGTVPQGPWDAVPGTVRYFGDYELLTEIARGGMGVVYRAKQVSLNREVAVKMILAGQLAGEKDVQRFRAEAEAAANLDHSNILPIYEVGEHQGQHYFSMKYVTGGSLADRLQPNPGPTDRGRVELLAKVCRAVHFAHQRGILHRDLKPANVLLDADGTPYVTDFGLAKRVEGESHLTQSGAIVGTPSYMPPEQARGERHLTTAADVYALGAILYEVLTGRPPFRGGTMIDTVLQVLEREPDHPKKVNPAADGDLSVVVLKCLEKDPANRYSSAAAVADDLDRWLRGEPVTISPATRWERVRKWVRRNPLPTALAVSLLIGTTVATGLAIYATTEADRANREAANAKAAERVARRQAAEAAVDKGLQLFDEGKPLAGQLWFAEALVRNPEDEEYLSLHRQRIDFYNRFARYYHPMIALIHSSPAVSSALFSSDGRRVVSASGNTARIGDIKTRKSLTPPLEHKGQVFSVSLAPDGRRVVTASFDHTARVWDAETGKLLTPPLEHKGPVFYASFAPDGRRVVTASGDHTARVWDAETGKPLTPGLEHKSGVHSALFTPDGRRVVTVSGNTARVWDAETGKSLTPPLEHMNQVYSASFAPDGRRIVTASADHTARVWDVETGKLLNPPLEHKDAVVSASFGPDGRLVVTRSLDKLVLVWDAGTGKPLTPLLEHKQQVNSASFAPDGRRVVTASNDNTARVWDAETGKPLTPPLEHKNQVLSASFTPDGRRVVTASRDHTARVWDAETGKLLSPPFEHKDQVLSATFAADGRRVVTASRDRAAWVWDTGTGKPLAPPLEHKGDVMSASFAPDGRPVVVTALVDKTARVWDAETGKPLTPPLEHKNQVLSASFAPDARRVVTTSLDNMIRVWDAETGKHLSPPLEHMQVANSASFAPDGRRVVTASRDHTARVWDAETGKPVSALLEHKSGVNSASFAPDGRRVVTASNDNTARVWDAETGKPLTPPLEHNGPVISASFAPDGRRIVTASEDSTALVWDAETGKPLTPPLEHKNWVLSESFAADGRRVVTANEENTAQVRDVAANERSDSDRVKIAQAKSGGRIDATGSIQPLTTDDQRAIWNEMREKYPTEFTGMSDGHQKVWYSERLSESESANDHFAAAFHLRQLLRLDPASDKWKSKLSAAEAELRNQQPREVAPLPRAAK
jgi:WD40 repeat protein